MHQVNKNKFCFKNYTALTVKIIKQMNVKVTVLTFDIQNTNTCVTTLWRTNGFWCRRIGPFVLGAAKPNNRPLNKYRVTTRPIRYVLVWRGLLESWRPGTSPRTCSPTISPPCWRKGPNPNRPTTLCFKPEALRAPARLCVTTPTRMCTWPGECDVQGEPEIGDACLSLKGRLNGESRKH